MKHTEGPWICSERASHFDISAKILPAEIPFVIAQVYGKTAFPGPLAEANAKLIAAAPALLRLLQQFVSGFAIHPHCDCGVCEARVLIADIEGEAEETR